MDLPFGVTLSIAKRRFQPKPTQVLSPSHNKNPAKPNTKTNTNTNNTTTNNPDQLDCSFYVKAYKDVNPRFTNAFTHYYTIGRFEERLPNENKFKELYPVFNLSIYIEKNSDLSRLPKEELMSHFHSLGRFECRAYR